MMTEAYAYKNSNDILMKSSSGGAFMGICNAFVKDIAKNTQWSVYGAKFDDEFRVVHGRATTIAECEMFCGSKYVQSDMKDCFDKIVEDIVNGCVVLFTGTPCQIAAVKSYLERKGCGDGNLYTIDIVCHGTPQPHFWEDYIKYLEKTNHSKLTNFSFRYKK